MSDLVTVEIEGLAELQQSLREAGGKLTKSSLAAALQAGIDVIEREVKRRTPVKTGLLREDIVTSVSTSDQEGIAELGFGSQGRIARLVEFGHRSRGASKASRNGSTHVPAHPFLRPSVAASKNEAVDTFSQKIAESLPAIGE